MVLVLKEANLTSVSCEVDVEDDGKQPFEKLRDRSLSYIDVRCQEHWLGGNSKIFENIYKFGRPRQRISDVLAFDEFEKDERLGKKRYHFGQCLVLPEALSTFSLKEEIQNNKKIESTYRSNFSAQLRQPGSNNFIRNKKKMFFNDLRKDTQTVPELYGFENEMYRWSETPTENRSKRLSRRSLFEDNGNMSWKSGKTVESRKELTECYNREEDNEVQINSRFRKDFKKTYEFNDKYNNQNTLENRNRNQQVFDEVRSIDARISDIRENWRLRVARENEAKQSNLRSTLEREKNQKYVMDEDEWSKSFKSTLIAQKEKKKKELHRSKSTPDMLEEIGRRKLEIWVHDEPKRNGSLMEVCNRSWEVYNDQQEADSLNEPNSLHEPVPSPDLSGVGKSRNSGLPSGKNFFEQFLTSRTATPMEMFSNTEPFSQFWVILSNIYGQALIILMFAFSLTEVMDNSVKLLSLQGIFLMYLYVGSIAVIICIYIWVLIDSCSSIQTNEAAGLVPPTITTSIVHDRETELQNISTSKFGSLKKAHITRDKSSNTSFYLRIGAIAFGLGTLVFNGLEMAMHSMMEGSCLNDVVFVHPILHGLFTFLQMHFLFVNSQVLVERFGLVARFGFMHLAATNLALWIRLVIWESGNEWTHYVHLSQNGFSRSPNDVPTPLQLRSFPKFIVRKEREINFDASDNGLYQAISKNHISQVVSLHQCLNNNSLGQLWTSSMPFLYPFIIQFSLIAAAVTYIMGQNVAKDRLFFQKQKKSTAPEGKISSLPTVHDTLNSWSVDCGGASKGLFLGILCLVTGVVVIIIFLVVKENEDFPSDTIFWLTSGTLMTILSITTVVNVVGLIQIRKLSVIGTKMTPLDKILSVVSVLGVQLYTILGIVVGASGMVREFGTDSPSSFSEQKRHGMLLAVSLIQLLQTIMQASFAVEGIRRTTLSRTQTLTKPARQVITFLIFSNAVLWAFDTFVVQSWVSQELQLRFFGVLAWGVISRLGLPLLVFYRFHSCVLLLEIWKKSYQSLHLEAGN